MTTDPDVHTPARKICCALHYCAPSFEDEIF